MNPTPSDYAHRRFPSISVLRRSAPAWARHRADTGWAHAVAVSVLALLVVVVWGHPVLSDFTALRLANGGDSVSFEFYLGWNLHALQNSENPFFTPNMYAPAGLDLGNAISVPGPSLVLAPVTFFAGATAAYNVGVLLAVFLASVSTYFLALEITGRVSGSFIAAVLMIVNPYFTGHSLSHFNLLWIFGFPLVAFLFLRCLRGRMRARWLVLGTAVAVAFTFGASTELVVTQVVFGAVAVLLALLLSRGGRRPLLVACGWLAAGGVAGALVSTPLIAAALGAGIPAAPANPPALYSTDLLNVLTPTRLFLVGGEQTAPWTDDWLGNDAENTAYIPVIILALAASLFLARRTRFMSGVALFAIVALILSFGPALVIDGTPSVWMPWALTSHVPGLDHALPSRFSTFAFLAVLVVIAVGWPSGRRATAVAAGAVAITAVMLLPDFRVATIPVPVADLEFVESGAYREVIERDEIALVLPGGQAGPGLQWVTKSDFYFKVPSGNGGGAAAPPDLLTPVGRAVFEQDRSFDYGPVLEEWARARDVAVVLVPRQYRFYARTATRIFGDPDERVGRVLVWRLGERG